MQMQQSQDPFTGGRVTEKATPGVLQLGLLDAIERGLFSKLPGGIYNISYIRQYARAIECDEARLLDYYRASAAVG